MYGEISELDGHKHDAFPVAQSKRNHYWPWTRVGQREFEGQGKIKFCP